MLEANEGQLGFVGAEWHDLPSLFALNAKRNPHQIALDIPPGIGRAYRDTVTYEELDYLASGYASRFTELGVGEQIIAILVPRASEHLWAAQLGALRAGFAYVCIEPALPDEVIRRILLDATPIAIVSDPEYIPRLVSLADHHQMVLSSDDIHPTEDFQADENLRQDRLAYLIYTSGTSGLPKGVMIEERSISNLVRSDLREFQLGAQDRIAQGSSASYDSSVEETWLAFAAGATLVVMDDDTARLGPDLVAWLQNERITVLCPPPTLLRTMACSNPREALPNLKLLYVGGEALTEDVANAWAPGRRLVNGYGPTECTVTCVRTDIVENGEITIGKPVDGITAYVAAEDGREALPGEMGELYLAGIGLARGYRNLSEVTQKKFVEHPEFGRIYRTGDLVRLEPSGNLSYFGRIDAQIKLRGYRIELEAIEAIIAQFKGVRETACRLQKQDDREWLSAHLVLENPAQEIDFEELREFIGERLPRYMVPDAYTVCDVLPKSVGGKLRRDALEFVAPHFEHHSAAFVPPESDLEKRVVLACQKIFGLTEPLSIKDDFFSDLGGSSLLASRIVTLLRTDSETSSITVRDIYEGRTIEGIAQRTKSSAAVTPLTSSEPTVKGNPILATCIQALVLFMELVFGSTAGAWFMLKGVPWFDQLGDWTMLLIVWPLIGLFGIAFLTPVTIGLAVLVKQLLIGTYKTGKEPVWGSFFVRNWIVRLFVRLIPWRNLEGTEFANMALRALGAKIGKNVYFHQGSIPLFGGWDLLDIGDNVAVCQDAVLNVWDLEAGQVVLGSVQIGANSVVETRAMVGPGSQMGEGSMLTPLSSLEPGAIIPKGEKWNGIPARPAGATPQPRKTEQSEMTPIRFAFLLTCARSIVHFVQMLPFQVAFIVTYRLVQSSSSAFSSLPLWLGVCLAISLACVPVMVVLEAMACRLLGKVEPGTIPLRSPAFARVSLKSMMVEASGRWLSGTLFWPVWLRMAGMSIGRDCEISTIIDVVPELISIDSHVFFADGVYLGSPSIQEGRCTLRPVSVSSYSFVGNHAVIPGGQSLPPNILLGVCTVADDCVMAKSTAWFGLPPIELLKREIVPVDEDLTFKPTPIRFWNRIFWESLRFTVPAIPLFSFYLWWDFLSDFSPWMRSPLTFVLGATLSGAATAAFLCGLVLGLKWALLGKVKEGIHPLWSCWCSRWDFLYVAWGEWAEPILHSLEGSLLLIPYLRAMGMKIGKRVVLSDGFSQVVDPDMIIIEDDATVSANYQAHTFEDRVLKIGHVVVKKGATLGRATVPLYGAVVGEHTRVEPNSVIMKHEHLLPGRRYQGAPSRQIETIEP